MKRTILPLFFFFISSSAQATNLTTMLEPGWLKYEIEPVFELKDFRYSSAHISLGATQNQLTIPVIFHYGVSSGVEGALYLPFAWYFGTSLNLNGMKLSEKISEVWGQGFGDMSLGIKYRLLDDTGKSPALFIETLLKLPTGTSALENYSRSLLGRDALRGTGTGSLDIVTHAILSKYMDPLEAYVRLSFTMRGADDRQVEGMNEHVDYGSETQALGGLEMDLGKNWTVAFETHAVINAASAWTRNGANALDSMGSSVEAFRTATLAASGINLGTTTEWYLGPVVSWRIVDAFQLGLRAQAGMTRDSVPLRVGVDLTGYFNLHLNILALLRGGEEKEEDPAVTGASNPLESSRGNLQRYIHQRLKAAESAAAGGKWEELAEEVAVVEELGAVTDEARQHLRDYQSKLQALAEESLSNGDEAGRKGNWVAAVRHWRKALHYRPSLEPARQALRANQQAILESGKQIYKKGIDLYVEGKVNEALTHFEDAQVLLPGDEKIQKSLEKTRDRIKALQKIK